MTDGFRAGMTLGAGVCNGAVHFHFLRGVSLKQQLGELLTIDWSLGFALATGSSSHINHSEMLWIF